MAWLRVDDGFPEHAKILALKRSERWTWLEVLAYCARQSNGGKVPIGVCETMKHVTPAFLARCQDVGLLDETDGGYVVHDWSVYNPRDPTNAARQQRYRNAHRNGDVTETVTVASVTNVTPPAQARARGPSRPQDLNPSFLPTATTDVGDAADGKVGRIELGQVLRDMP